MDNNLYHNRKEKTWYFRILLKTGNFINGHIDHFGLNANYIADFLFEGAKNEFLRFTNNEGNAVGVIKSQIAAYWISDSI